MAEVNKDAAICANEFKPSINQKTCYFQVAKAIGDMNMCDQAEKIIPQITLAGFSPGMQSSYSTLEDCYVGVSKIAGDISICQTMPYKKTTCIIDIAKYKKDVNICKKIGTGNIFDVAYCELQVELEKNK